MSDVATFSASDDLANTELPARVTRPLRIGCVVVFGALLLFALWASLAPLATSIPAPGHLNASRPSYDVQHPFGGKIAQIHVDQHEEVARGAVLMTLDVDQERAERDALQAALTPMIEERAAIRAALSDRLPQAGDGAQTSDAAQMAVRRMRNMQTAMQLRADMSATLEGALEERMIHLSQSMARREEQRLSMLARHKRYASLRAEGAFRAADMDALGEDILELEAALERDRAEVSSLRNQAIQAAMQVMRERLEFRLQLLDRLAQLEEAIPRLKRQILRLSAQIDQAQIHAPEAGIVAALYFDTAAMVIPRGETVLTLARPSARHQVSFLAHPQVIDQLRVGMPGQLTLAALPQRSHPRVQATITSLSPEARRNAEGAVMGYDGIAQIDAEDHAALLATLGDEATLATDMPVTVVFTGRSTTFGAYLMGPFWSFMQKAMQD